MDRKCCECKYHDNKSLECFRLPPQIVLNVGAKIMDVPGLDDENNFVTRFPRVNNHRSCGEFSEHLVKSLNETLI